MGNCYGKDNSDKGKGNCGNGNGNGGSGDSGNGGKSTLKSSEINEAIS